MKIDEIKEMLSSPQVKSFFLSKTCFLHARNCDVLVKLEDIKVMEYPQGLSMLMVFIGSTNYREAQFLIDEQSGNKPYNEEAWASFGGAVYSVYDYSAFKYSGIDLTDISFGIKLPYGLINSRGVRAFMEWDAYVIYKEETDPYTRFEIMDI